MSLLFILSDEPELSSHLYFQEMTQAIRQAMEQWLLFDCDERPSPKAALDSLATALGSKFEVCKDKLVLLPGYNSGYQRSIVFTAECNGAI